MDTNQSQDSIGIDAIWRPPPPTPHLPQFNCNKYSVSRFTSQPIDLKIQTSILWIHLLTCRVCARIWSSIRNVICKAIHKPHGYLICIEMNTVGNYYNLLVKIDTRMHNYAQPFTVGHIGWAFLRSIIKFWYFIILFKCWTLHNILVALMPNSKSPTQWN